MHPHVHTKFCVNDVTVSEETGAIPDEGNVESPAAIHPAHGWC